MNIPKTYLTESIAIDDKSILRILTQDKQINEEDPALSYYKKLAEWALHKQQKLKNIELNKIELSSRELITKGMLANRLTTLGHTLNALKDLMDNKGRYNPASELSNLIQQTTLEILAGLSGIKDPKKSDTKKPDPKKPDPKKPDPVPPDPVPEPEPKASGGRDWTAYKAKKLANANGKTSDVLNEFYDEYYGVEYAGIIPTKKQEILAKLKSLDKILIPEFNKLGYNPEVNPFASFLKILIKEKFDIFEKLTFNTYGAIHNSFIEKYITGNMLGQKFDKTNILFCSDLYNKHGLDMVEYLNLQNQVSAAQKTSEYSGDANLVPKMFIYQPQEDSNESYADKVRQIKDKTTENIVQPGSSKAKLRSILEIRELYRYLFGHEAETARKNDVSKIIQEAANKDAILDMVYYLISQYKLKAEYEVEVNNWLKDVKYKYESENKKIDTSKKILAKYSNMDSLEITSLIDKLRAYYTKKQKEAKKET